MRRRKHFWTSICVVLPLYNMPPSCKKLSQWVHSISYAQPGDTMSASDCSHYCCLTGIRGHIFSQCNLSDAMHKLVSLMVCNAMLGHATLSDPLFNVTGVRPDLDLKALYRSLP